MRWDGMEWDRLGRNRTSWLRFRRNWKLGPRRRSFPSSSIPPSAQLSSAQLINPSSSNAQKYANLLEKRFPDSPRVAILLATIMHAKPTHLDDKGKGNGNGNGKGSGKEEARVLLERVLEFNEEDIVSLELR